MKPVIECIPNFSTGRDRAAVDAIVSAMSGISGAWLLDRHSDPDHNRSVITLAGEPERVAEAVLRGVGVAAERIDLTRQTGAHPRIGAADVVPFVPISDFSMSDCVELARRTGREIWKRYKIPVYFYEAAATCPERVNLENVRQGQFELLQVEALSNSGRAPDVGGPRLHPTAGATAVGAREFLIAYNINLNTNELSIANRIAKAVRSSSGGLSHVKAIGVYLKTRDLAQVSLNLTNFRQTSLREVFQAVREQAERMGTGIVGSEIVGLVPRAALDPDAQAALLLENFSPEMILENRLAMAQGDRTPA